MRLAGIVALAVLVGFAARGSRDREPGTQHPETGLLLRVGQQKPGGYTVTAMPLEVYVARVLAGEAARDSQPAALEALAIAIRTFALANSGRHRADGFDLCDQTHCQVVRTATAATERAAQVTAGRVLLRDGAAASIFYSASCGGRTEIPSAVWPGAEDPSFLPSRDDDACGGAPAWTAELPEADLLRAFRAAGYRGDRLRELRIIARNGSGRVARLKVGGLSPDQISGQDLRVAVGRTLGWHHIKSSAFELRKQGDAYRFSGHGSGHGVGMCVIGSVRLAVDGKSAEQILNRYFPGLEISPGDRTVSTAAGSRSRSDSTIRSRSTLPIVRTAPTPEVLLSLPDGDEGERDALLKHTLIARDDLARALGVTAPGHVTLRFHPTADEYERVTGRAWFTSGAVVNSELHLLPLAVLRERGMLDRTIRRELVHLMTEAVLDGRPIWVREGAAIYFADRVAMEVAADAARQRPSFKPEPRVSCPEDYELLRPVSVGALSNAYARARTCFEKQIRAGKSWRDIR